MGSSGRGGGHSFHESTAFKHSLAKTESNIRYSDVEHFVALDKDGNEVLRGEGGEYSVELSRADERAIRGTSVTHNHPGGTTFSPEDIETMVDLELRSLRAVGSDGSTYTLTRKFNPIADRKAFYTDYGKIAKANVARFKPQTKELKAQYERGTISEEEYREAINDISQRWSRMNSRWLMANAKKYGYDYEAVLRADKESFKRQGRAR